jgi:hypothetical protein
MKPIATLLLASTLFGGASAAETIVCSHIAYATSGQSMPPKTVLTEIRVDGDVAIVGPFAQRYRVLENSKYGLVLAYSFAGPELENKPPSIGAFVFAIDRLKRVMVRNNIIVGESDAYRGGSCTFLP